MRYWGFLAGKLGVSAGCMYGLFVALDQFWPAEPQVFDFRPSRFGYNLQYTLAVGIWFLLCCGVAYLCILDQRYRCRVCLRRLRMPIETGSWSRMLQFGRPRIEYICPYGHGTLNVAELQISGLENPEWTPHAEMWEELCAASRDSERE
ncbi:MAG TPA: hypothetical protein VG672_08630 [Bryobacteraceae bacterium]|jgi:hypothetical protein|nr:hypothetical protein [Bryobacteraceae bacterium]